MYNNFMQPDYMRKKIEKVGEIFVYVVEPGDNVWKISKMFNTKPEYIMYMNNLKNDSKLLMNQRLLVPVLIAGYDDNRIEPDYPSNMIQNNLPINNYDYSNPSQFYF